MPSTQKAHGPAPRILIADDDPELLGMLSIRFGRKGYQVLEAIDGNQALQKARSEHPDVIVLDVMMPGKNGWEIARDLKKDEDTQDIGIVMLTAIGPKTNEMASPLYGADSYLDKPFEFADLESRVDSLLGRGKA